MAGIVKNYELQDALSKLQGQLQGLEDLTIFAIPAHITDTNQYRNRLRSKLCYRLRFCPFVDRVFIRKVNRELHVTLKLERPLSQRELKDLLSGKSRSNDLKHFKNKLNSKINIIIIRNF